ncbi:hypothetical protein [Massilia putida]|uniref:hypothetical protein n=1 Tax=Massilia putida TaxID=1141883 RepID=UPI00095313ED|nr:hypothetical protein [Massilia putida]
MNKKLIAVACMTLCSSAAFAATATLTCDTSSAEKMVNTCATDAKATDFVSLYVAGSSALASVNDVVLKADLFDSSKPVITLKYTDAGSFSAGQVSGWYGWSKPNLTGGTSKRLFVVYNKMNGSAAGVSQMLAKFDGKTAIVKESNVLSVGPVAGVPGSCVADASSTDAAPVLNCPTSALRQADMAISDVAPVELYKLYAEATAKLSTLKVTPLAMQGFGVAVSGDLYAALQSAQGTSGQPTVRRVDYASIVTGKAKSASVLLPGNNGVLTLARRDDLSGTQAASNMYFANNACGNNHDPKGKLIANVLGGAQPIIGAAASAGNLVVQEYPVGGDVVKALNKSGYAIGVISLTSAPSASDTWKFVKLDGVSPTPDAKQRAAFAGGDYGFAVTSFAVEYVKPKVDKSALTQAVIQGLKDSTLHDLRGIAYLDGGISALQSKVVRPDNNNCAPLVRGDL